MELLRRQEAPKGPRPTDSLAQWRRNLERLFKLLYEDQITGANFASEERRLNVRIAALEEQIALQESQKVALEATLERFERLIAFLTETDWDVIWEAATTAERRTLVEDLLDTVNFYPDHLTVQVAGAPPIVVELQEVGLRAGSRSLVSEAVSEARHQQSPTGEFASGRANQDSRARSEQSSVRSRSQIGAAYSPD